MPDYSNYPRGFNDGVTIRGVPIVNAHAGKIFWVYNGSALQEGQRGGSDGNKGTYDSPFSTIDYAIGQCTADRNDVILAKAGHAESIAADSGIDIDVAGVTIIGLGTGADRPTITFGTDVAADFKLAANNVWVENFLFIAGLDALTGPIEISADDCTLKNCEYRDASSIETTDCIVSASTPLRMTIDGFKFISDGGTGGTQQQSIIQLSGSDEALIRNCWLVGDCATGVIEDAGTSDQIRIEDCLIENTSSAVVGILLTATTSGVMRGVKIKTNAAADAVTTTNDMQFYDVEHVRTDGGGGAPVGGVAAGGFVPGLGYLVQKEITLAADPDDAFTVTGSCLINLMVGEVTTVFATVSSMSINTSTGGTVIAASTDVTTTAAGTWLTVTGDIADGLNGDTTGANRSADASVVTGGVHAPFIVTDDKIFSNLNTTGTGAVRWSIYYLPLEATSSIAASA